MKAVARFSQRNQPCKCTGGVPLRNTRQTIEATVTLSNGKWEITPDPIRLEHPDDTVIWNLVHLMIKFPDPGTKFKIIFSDGPGGLMKISSELGPFATLTNGAALTGDRVVGEKGCYAYDLWVYPPGREVRLPIDPQIDHVAPPGINPLIRPDEDASGEGPSVKGGHQP